MKLNNLTVYVWIMGKAFKVLAWFPSGELGIEQANDYIDRNPGASVIADLDGMILLADKRDNGAKAQA